MPSPSADDAERTPSRSALLAMIDAGRHGDAQAALSKVTALIPALEKGEDDELGLIGLWGRAELMWHADISFREVATTCDLLEQAAQERLAPLWVAVARALRTAARLDGGDVNSCVADLARVDLDQFGDELLSVGGSRLLDLLATAYGRLRLHDRVDDVRTRTELSLSTRRPIDQAVHWAHRAAELAVRTLEPVATGADEPDQRLLRQAAAFADQLSTVPPDLVPDQLRRGADAVRALEAAYRGRPAEALRLLGEDGFRPAMDLPGLERRLAMIAGMHAQALIGAVETARHLDYPGDAPPPSLPYLVLDVCRAVERLHLETHNDGDPVPALHRMNALLVRLGRTGMDLVGETARQALEHQGLRVENRTDALTGVGNRRALDEELRSLLRFSPLPMSLLLVDVDHFKAVNDRFTHVVGDEVLRRVARALAQQLRGGDRLVRYGGDEFVVLMPHTGDTEAEAVATGMIEAVRVLRWDELAAGLTVRITTGCGTLWSLSHRRPDGDAEHLFRLADEQLLQAKRRRTDPTRSEATTSPRTGTAASAVTPTPPRGTTPPAAATPPPSTPSPATPSPSTPSPATPSPATPSPATPSPATTPSDRLTPRAPSLADLLDEKPAPHSPLTSDVAVPLTGSLPLYQALLQDPPRIDPHLGLLPPRGTTPLTAPDASARPIPDPTPGPQPRTEPRTEPHRPTSSDQPAGRRAAGTSEAPDEPQPPRIRSRRRPNVIDLSSVEKRRSPFG